MISGRDFFVLSDDWNGLPTSTMHLFRHISPHNRVFWLNVINRLPELTWNDVEKVTRTLNAWAAQVCGGKQRSNGRNSASPSVVDSAGRDSASPSVVDSATPFIIPWFKPAIRRINCRSLLRSFKRLSNRYGIRDPIVFTTWPSTADFVKRVVAPVKIYYCVDEWLDYPGLNAADFRVMENELLEHVDGLVATSRDLKKKGQGCCPSLHLPQGVDFQHFNRKPAEVEPVSVMDGIPRPIVGFFGVIGEWVDLKLVATLSRRFPDVSFVLIGKSVVSMDAVADCPNVHQIGVVPYADLPRYAVYFDVGLIPFVTSKLTHAVSPVKLMEYFALGLPVLATRLREVEDLEGPLHLASTADEFSDNLQTVLAQSNCSSKEAREVARRNTWHQRAEKLANFIAGLF